MVLNIIKCVEREQNAQNSVTNKQSLKQIIEKFYAVCSQAITQEISMESLNIELNNIKQNIFNSIHTMLENKEETEEKEAFHQQLINEMLKVEEFIAYQGVFFDSQVLCLHFSSIKDKLDPENKKAFRALNLENIDHIVEQFIKNSINQIGDFLHSIEKNMITIKNFKNDYKIQFFKIIEDHFIAQSEDNLLLSAIIQCFNKNIDFNLNSIIERKENKVLSSAELEDWKLQFFNLFFYYNKVLTLQQQIKSYFPGFMFNILIENLDNFHIFLNSKDFNDCRKTPEKNFHFLKILVTTDLDGFCKRLLKDLQKIKNFLLLGVLFSHKEIEFFFNKETPNYAKNKDQLFFEIKEKLSYIDEGNVFSTDNIFSIIQKNLKNVFESLSLYDYFYVHYITKHMDLYKQFIADCVEQINIESSKKEHLFFKEIIEKNHINLLSDIEILENYPIFINQVNKITQDNQENLEFKNNLNIIQQYHQMKLKNLEHQMELNNK